MSIEVNENSILERLIEIAYPVSAFNINRTATTERTIFAQDLFSKVIANASSIACLIPSEPNTEQAESWTVYPKPQRRKHEGREEGTKNTWSAKGFASYNQRSPVDFPTVGGESLPRRARVNLRNLRNLRFHSFPVERGSIESCLETTNRHGHQRRGHPEHHDAFKREPRSSLEHNAPDHCQVVGRRNQAPDDL